MQQLALEEQMDHGAGWQYNGSGGSDERSGDSSVALARDSPEPSGTLAMPAAEVRVTAFKTADVNSNTWLNLHEVHAAALHIWPALAPRHMVNKAVIVHAYHAADENDDGKIGRREFRLFCLYAVFFSRWWSELEVVGTAVRFREDGSPASVVVDADGFEQGCAALGVPHSVPQFLQLVSDSATAAQAAGAPVGAQIIPLDVFATWCARSSHAEQPQQTSPGKGVGGGVSRLSIPALRKAAWSSPEAGAAPSPLRDGERRSR